MRCRERTSKFSDTPMRKHLLRFIAIFLLFAGCRSTILEDPALTITYSVAQRAHVLLTVENSYNTVVATLVDGVRGPGFYSATMNAEGLPEGVYFYSLECRGVDNSYYVMAEHKFLLLKRI